MRQLLVVALLMVTAYADKDQQPAEAANPPGLYGLPLDDHLDDHHHDELPGPHVLRSTHSKKVAEPDDHGPQVQEQNVIIRKTYDPDYYEPTIILDYRYMKTGGRDYTRGPGGQYVILPKGIRVKEKKEFENFDALLEHLRLKNLANSEYHRAHFNDGHN